MNRNVWKTHCIIPSIILLHLNLVGKQSDENRKDGNRDGQTVGPWSEILVDLAYGSGFGPDVILVRSINLLEKSSESVRFQIVSNKNPYTYRTGFVFG